MNKDNKKLGIIFIIFSTFSFAFMSLFIRLSGELPIFQKMFFRNLVALFFSFILVLKNNQGFFIESKARKFVFLRAVFGTIGIFCNFYAIDNMNLADAGILQKLSPFFGILASFVILMEVPTKLDIIFTFIAFVGAIFVIKPSFNSDILPSLVGVLGGLVSGIAYTFIRKVKKFNVKSNQIIFYFSVVSCLASIFFMIRNFVPMTYVQVIYLMLAGVSAMCGQIGITKAYIYAKAKELATFDYTYVLFSAFIAFIFLSQIPDIYSIIGYIIIVGAVISKSRLEKKYES